MKGGSHLLCPTGLFTPFTTWSVVVDRGVAMMWWIGV